VVPSEPSRIETPEMTLPVRSGCLPSTPVSRMATVVIPVGTTAP
jgi:hypothetical protein